MDFAFRIFYFVLQDRVIIYQNDLERSHALNHNFWIMTLVANHFNISIMSLIGLLLVFCSCVQFMVVAYSLRDIGAMT